MVWITNEPNHQSELKHACNTLHTPPRKTQLRIRAPAHPPSPRPPRPPLRERNKVIWFLLLVGCYNSQVPSGKNMGSRPSSTWVKIEEKTFQLCSAHRWAKAYQITASAWRFHQVPEDIRCTTYDVSYLRLFPKLTFFKNILMEFLCTATDTPKKYIKTHIYFRSNISALSSPL